MPTLRLAVRLGAVVVACGALVIPGAAIANAGVAVPAHKGILPPKNPGRSLRADPFFLGSASCRSSRDGTACNTGALKAIAHARKALEKMAGISFSLKAYEKLTPLAQLFVTVNVERIARGEAPAVVLTKSLDKVAQEGAKADEDPPLQNVPDPLPGGGRWVGLGANWAGGWDNALGADYAWMYDDGLGSQNLDCKKGHTQGCWGHRDNILGHFNPAGCAGQRNVLAMGAGYVASGAAFGDSETELFARICGHAPTDVVTTWTKVRKRIHFK